MKHKIAGILICVVLGVAFAACAGTPGASTNTPGPGRQIRVIDERENFTRSISGNLYWGEKRADAVKWVAGHEGEGIDFNDQQKTQIRLNYTVLTTVKRFTFSTWINWRGAGLNGPATYADDDGGQLIFGISGGAGHFKLVANDYEKGGGIDFAGGYYNQDVYCTAGVSLPKNEWAMVTATMDGTYMSLYLNGEIIAQEEQSVVPGDLGVDLFRVGSSFWDPPSLNAILDQTSIWLTALSAEEILNLYEETK
jgi:hypothetical protein